MIRKNLLHTEMPIHREIGGTATLEVPPWPEIVSLALERVHQPPHWPMVDLNASPTQQAIYEVLRDHGVSETFAAMQALKQFPGVSGTQSSFMAGRSNGQEYDHMPADMRRFYFTKAKKGGVNPRGKVYMSGLAKEPGDPKAWVESADDVKKRVKQEGWSITDK